jgi:hypothetical protein
MMIGKMRNAYKILVGKHERDHLKDLSADTITLQSIVYKYKDEDWIESTQDRDHWRVLVNTVIKLQVP